jgi:hypothetical protein
MNFRFVGGGGGHDLTIGGVQRRRGLNRGVEEEEAATAVAALGSLAHSGPRRPGWWHVPTCRGYGERGGGRPRQPGWWRLRRPGHWQP